MVSEIKCEECRCIAVDKCSNCESALCLKHKECPFCKQEQKVRAKKWILYRNSYPFSLLYFYLKWWARVLIALVIIGSGTSLFARYSETYASFMSFVFFGVVFIAFRKTLIDFETYLKIQQ